MSNMQNIESRITLLKAMTAIQNDDRQALKGLLSIPGVVDAQSHLICEETVVDKVNGDTLLIYAVRKQASRCIRMLMRPPYVWNPDKKNSFQRTAYEIAVYNSLIAEWIPLALHSRSNYPEERFKFSVDMHSVCFDFLRQNIFIMCHPERGHFAYSMNLPIVGMPMSQVNFDSVKRQKDIENTLLFFEMFIGITEKVEEPYLGRTRFWPWLMPKSHDAIHCKEYPHCLFQPTSGNAFDSFVEVFNKYKGHRLTDVRNHGYAGIDYEDKSGEKCLWAPMRLMEQCRISIRRLLTIYLAEINYSKDDTKKQCSLNVTNYIQTVNKLKTPMAMKYYLCYEDLWPILPYGLTFLCCLRLNEMVPFLSIIYDHELAVTQ